MGRRAPVRAIDCGDADAEGSRLGLAGDEAIDDVRHHGLHLRRVVDSQSPRRCAEDAEWLIVPDLVARLAKDPINDRLFRSLGRGDARRIGADVVFPPDLPLVVWQLAVAGSDSQRAARDECRRREERIAAWRGGRSGRRCGSGSRHGRRGRYDAAITAQRGGTPTRGGRIASIDRPGLCLEGAAPGSKNRSRNQQHARTGLASSWPRPPVAKLR